MTFIPMSRLALLLGLLFSARFGLAQFEGEPATLIARHGLPANFVPADLDGDGQEDLIAFTLRSAGGVYWMKQLDDPGEFSVPLTINADYTGIHDLRAADADGDGDLDVLLTARHDWDQNYLVWLERRYRRRSSGPHRVQ